MYWITFESALAAAFRTRAFDNYIVESPHARGQTDRPTICHCIRFEIIGNYAHRIETGSVFGRIRGADAFFVAICVPKCSTPPRLHLPPQASWSSRWPAAVATPPPPPQQKQQRQRPPKPASTKWQWTLQRPLRSPRRKTSGRSTSIRACTATLRRRRRPSGRQRRARPSTAISST